MSPDQTTDPVSEPPASDAGISRVSVASCPNCGTPINGPYCHHCGQNQKRVDRFFLSLIGEAFEDVFSWNSRTARTLFALLFRPAFLTREYFIGRRARYIPPLRLYLITSVSFFFLVSGLNLLNGPDTDAIASNITKDGEAQTSPADDWREELRDAVALIRLDSLTDTQNDQLGQRLLVQTNKMIRVAEEDPSALLDQVIDVVPPILFFLLPVFALLLKIVYFSSGKYYTEHLVLALHNHSFLFVTLTAESLLDLLPGTGTVTAILSAWIPLYLYLSLRRVFGQGYFTTFLNFVILGVLYLILVFIGAIVAFVAGVMAL